MPPGAWAQPRHTHVVIIPTARSKRCYERTQGIVRSTGGPFGEPPRRLSSDLARRMGTTGSGESLLVFLGAVPPPKREAGDASGHIAAGGRHLHLGNKRMSPRVDTGMTVTTHAVLATPLYGPWPDGFERAVFGMGCFWGVERIFWEIDGVHSTAAGYAGGTDPDPTYRAVCSGATGHAEVVQVVYDPSKVSYETLLTAFWDNHDPTQGLRQGNDVGSQYRSIILTTSADQQRRAEASRQAYAPIVADAGLGRITTDIRPAGDFFHAEDEHQQYLHHNPGGYCNHGPQVYAGKLSVTSLENRLADLPVTWNA